MHMTSVYFDQQEDEQPKSYQKILQNYSVKERRQELLLCPVLDLSQIKGADDSNLKIFDL